MIICRVYTVLSHLHIEVEGTSPATSGHGRGADIRQLAHAVIQIDARPLGQQCVEGVLGALEQVEGYASDVSHYVGL